MGYNTTVVIFNDGFGAIQRKPEEFVKNLINALSEHQRTSETVDVPCDNECNVAQVIETHHADLTTCVLVGGNCGTNLGVVGGFRHNIVENQKRMLQSLLADKKFK